MLLAGRQMLRADGRLTAGWVQVDPVRGVITGLGADAAPGRVDVAGALLLPGLVDMHCHGGGGASFATEDAQEARTAAGFHQGHGTTTIVASLVTAAPDTLERQIATLVSLARRGEIAGIHLEGPWLSPRHHGAHDPDLLRLPVMAEVDRLVSVAAGHLRMVTIAPELPGALEAITRLSAAGVTVAIGHTDCDAEGLRRAVRAGASVVTHLCNGMRPMHHRDPGPVVAALAERSLTVELVMDGVHVHPEMAVLLHRASLARVALVTDAMAAAGCADGHYQLGGLGVQVSDGVARLEDGGSIAGSTLTLDRALRTAHAAGIPLTGAALSTTSIPARAMGSRAGTLAVGAPADLLMLDEELLPVAVWKAGVRMR